MSDPPALPPSRAIPNDARQQEIAATGPETRAAAPAATITPKEETRGTLLVTESPPAVAADREAPAPDVVEPLGIDKLCLCREIAGFGAFEPLHEPRVKVGKRILIYCEMTGMTYESKETSFVSRLKSKIEVRSVTDGSICWVHEFPPKTDVCASRRRDFFVNYRCSLSRGLQPGAYRLCLTQTDLVADRTSSAEIPFEIIP